MNEKITQPRLIALLSDVSGMSKRQSEEFIKALIVTLTEVIADHDSVKIKGFGTFKVTRIEARKSVNVSTGNAVEIPSHYRVSFIPDKKVAEAVNAPFEMFDTIELDDDLDEKELQAVSDEDMDVEIIMPEPSEVTPKPDPRAPISSATIAPESELNVPQEPTPVSEAAMAEENMGPEPFVETPIQAPTSHEEKEEESKGEELGERLEEEFGPVGPTNPFGPVDPDGPDNRLDTAAIAAIPETPATPAVENQTPEIQKVERAVATLTEKEKEIEKENNEILRKHSFNKGLILGIVATFIIMVGGFIALYFMMMNKLDSFLTKEDDNLKVTEQIVEEAVSPAVVEESIAEMIPETEPAQPEEPVEEIVGPIQPEPQLAAPEKTVAQKVEKAEEVATPVSDKPKYDTITKTRYLTTMAKEHYGNYHLWPYIYMENSKKLGHPDRIKPGTQVVIPSLSKYNVSASNPADIKKAKQLGVEIYRKFNSI